MDYKVLWSSKSEADIQSIYDYYLQFNEVAAIKMATAFRTKALLLKKNPYIASVEPSLTGFPKKYRSLITKRKYKLIYTVENDHVFIVRVWDCRQNPEKLLNSLLYKIG